MSRVYRFLTKAGITLGVDVNNSIAKVAFAACNDEDNFSKDTGRRTIDLLFDANEETLHAFRLNRRVVCFPYKGNTSKKDILYPLLDYLTDELSKREFFRVLIDVTCYLFDNNLNALPSDNKVTSAVAENLKKVRGHLSYEERHILCNLNNVKELYQIFFNWSGSVNSIYSKMKDFSTEVWTNKRTFETANSDSHASEMVASETVSG